MICGMWLDVINDKRICSRKLPIPCSVNVPAVFGLLLEHHLNVYETYYGNVARTKKQTRTSRSFLACTMRTTCTMGVRQGGVIEVKSPTRAPQIQCTGPTWAGEMSSTSLTEAP